MAVTVPEAKAQLNIPESATTDDTELELYVDAANEWITAKTGDTTAHPAVVKLATLFLIEHLWGGSQRGPAATPLTGGDTITVGSIGYAIPNRVLELLDIDIVRTAAPTGSFPDAQTWPDPPYWADGYR